MLYGEEPYYIDAIADLIEQKALAEEEKQALKAHKKNAVAEVKKLILQYNLTKGDIRGKVIKQLMGE